ncbi:MAG TPA: hypothetical protein VK958_00815 [Methylophilus sp.]|uniref:hypothetical protein n=1 Tax=Methylophilus sp. TaxID=29541 RepID=UPI002C62799F|nr:hypothetical protein [Methylophilus sp.]HSH85770.1 hypothetical protein [Methylophilus sp.]
MTSTDVKDEEGKPTDKPIEHECGLILQKVKVTAQLPQNILENVELRAAADSEIEIIKQILNGNSRTGNVEYYFENEHVKDEKNFYEPRRLTRNEWRYYVLEEKGFGDTLRLIDLLSNISDTPLDCSKLRTVEGGITYSPARLANLMDISHPSMPVYEISEGAISQIKELCDTYYRIENAKLKSEILRGLTLFDDLGSLPTHSHFIVIGLFAIFELLLTHQPELKDSSDSISHQLRKKMNLMSNRFDSDIDYKRFFGGVDHTSLWNALYKYRSLVAHGSATDFNSKDLKVLKNAQNANDFLTNVLRLLFRQCLKEPQLAADLKLC